MTDTAAIIGGGVIGGGWAARFLLNGWNVRVFDPDPHAERKIGEVLANARLALPQLYDVAMPAEGALSFHPSIAEAVEGATWVQESVPERLDIKHGTYREILSHAERDALVGSSASGFKPSELQESVERPGPIMVAHPFNPVYLLPLVELVTTDANSKEDIERAEAILRGIGMAPLHLLNEIDAHIADRLLEAVWREALWLVRDDIATTEEIDDAIRYGFGLRWAQMGLFETYRIAGGEAGMKHFIAQFGPCLHWPWTKLTDVPELTDELIEKIASQSDKQSGALSIRQLERLRDENLIGIMRSLKDRDSAAGALINAHERQIARPLAGHDGEVAAPLCLWEATVLPSWIDYNGHMTEYRYLQVFGDTTDALLRMIGVNRDYVAGGHSYYTVESHLMHLGEAKLGDRLTTTTQILSSDEKRIHLFHTILAGEQSVATAEQMLLHVDNKESRACPALPDVSAAIAKITQKHAGMPRPDTAGRHTGQRRSA
ncbi:carnitine 3-dehydrogenase [Hoeflea poritis]|uniref:L-carnitine dehydrogenase n=1 Tax=Hoeflea poritis TaxID=2993659 RepID=A0ABT4VHA7_9HYPH|nr:carnitine 3-dehydrogenase [Hoeflea poritis]MDA4844094.1 carnitine 3-dehydrogenase [Hoeflea poritis]